MVFRKMTPQSQNKFREWLDSEIASAKETIAEYQSFDHNSYGKGYDDGLYAALRSVRAYFTGED